MNAVGGGGEGRETERERRGTMTTTESIAGTGTVGITSVLQSAQSPDATLRGQAEQHLQQLRENNHAQFVASLAEELCEESKPIDTRRLAGLILKNELDARDEARKVSAHTRTRNLRALLRLPSERPTRALHAHTERERGERGERERERERERN